MHAKIRVTLSQNAAGILYCTKPFHVSDVCIVAAPVTTAACPISKEA